MLYKPVRSAALGRFQRPDTPVYLAGNDITVIIELIEFLGNDRLCNDANIFGCHRQFFECLDVREFSDSQRIVVVLQYWLIHVGQKHDAPLTRRNHPRLCPFVEAACFRQRTVTPAGYVVAGQRRIVRAARHFAVRIEHDRYAVLLRIGGKNTHPARIIVGTAR